MNTEERTSLLGSPLFNVSLVGIIVLITEYPAIVLFVSGYPMNI